MQKIIFAIGAIVLLSTTYTMAQQREIAKECAADIRAACGDVPAGAGRIIGQSRWGRRAGIEEGPFDAGRIELSRHGVASRRTSQAYHADMRKHQARPRLSA